MRTLATVVLLAVVACQAPSPAGPPVRLAIGGSTSDTVVVNSHRPTSLPVHAVDAAGRTVLGVAIRYAIANGNRVPVSPAGAVTCTQAGDFAVHAYLDDLSTEVTVRCRPVEYLRIPGPVQFVIGDSVLGKARALPLAAYSADGRPVEILAGTVGILDPPVASLAGLIVTPHAPGATLAWAKVGGREARIGVHVYHRVNALEALDTVTRIAPDRRLVAVLLRLGPGELRRQRLPPGGWMLSMLPEDEHDPAGLRLRVEGANCQPVMTPRRFLCDARNGATIIVYRPFDASGRPYTAGALLLRWMPGQ